MPMPIPDTTTGLVINEQGDWRFLALFDLAHLMFADGADAAVRTACLAAMELDRHLTADGSPVWMIKRVEAFHDGWGPVLYHMAMSDAALTCDWGHVSEAAHAVWAKFRSNPSVQFIPSSLRGTEEWRPDGLQGHWVMNDEMATIWRHHRHQSQQNLVEAVTATPLTASGVADAALARLCCDEDDLEAEPLDTNCSPAP